MSENLNHIFDTMILQTAFTVLILPSLLASVVSVHHTEWMASEYPNPALNPSSCQVPKGGLWLCDPDTVLSIQEVPNVLATIRNINEAAECVCDCNVNPDSGYVIGVAVVGAIKPETNMQVEKSTLASFSQTIKDQWFPVSGECDDKAVLLLSRNASQIYISLGSSLSSIVPLSSLDTIYSEIQPLLQETVPKYKSALETSLSSFVLHISGSQNLVANGTVTPPTSPMSTEAPEPENNLVWGILGVIAIMSILIFHYWIKY